MRIRNVASRRLIAAWTGMVLVAAPALLPCACSRDATYHGEAQEGGFVGALVRSFDLGEKVYAIVRSRLAASAVRPAEKVAALEARRDEFIASINAVLTPESLQNLGPSLRALFALVDDGTLPDMAANLADILEGVANEPDRRTLGALVALSSARGVVQTADVLDYAARTVNYREIDTVFSAVAELVRQNDGVDDQGRPNGERDLAGDAQALAGAALREWSRAPGAAGLLDGIAREMLVDAPVRSGAPLGGPAWIVRADRHGNPAVARDPQGALWAPFVDRDGDGAADVDSEGRPIDSNGAPIEVPPFGIPGAPGRDTEGRALAPGGAAPLYVYQDAKRTLLSHWLQLGGEGLRRHLDEQALDVAEIVLGARVVRDNGTPADPADDFLGFAPGGPVPDLVWGALEMAKPPETPKVLRAIAELGRTDPALGERLLVTIGKITEKLRPIATKPSTGSSAQTNAALDRLIALGERLFETRAAPPSVGRLLFDVVHSIGRSARELPGELALMMRYRKLALDASGNPLPAPQSEPVDWSLGPTRAGSAAGENRSILHQLLDMLAAADGCRTFVWAGRPLSETIIELMAGRSAGGVTTLIGFLQNPLVKFLVGLYCPGVKDDLAALDGLAASGALDGFLPIAKAFVDKGETRLLVDLLVTAQRDYAAVVRPYEEHVADVLASGAFDSIFDLLDLLVAGRAGQAVRDPVGGERAIDIVADAAARLLDHPAGGVPDRLGRAQPTLLHLVLEPLRRVGDQVAAANGGQALATALFYTATDLVIERVWNDNGTPADPQDDFEELRNPSLAPFVAKVLDRLARNLPQDAAARAARVAAAQAELVRLVEGKHFATAFDLGRTIRLSPAVNAIRDALVHVLTPDPVAQDDIFGALLKLAATALETRVDAQPLRDLAAFGADLFEPGARRVVPLVTGVSRLLVADRGETMITVLRNVLNEPAPSAGLPPGTAPAEALAGIFEDIRRAGAGGTTTAADQVADLERSVRDLVAFIRDDVSGLARIFEVIRTRPR